MASNPLLTLSSKGLLTGVEERCDRLWAYFMTSNATQSTLYLGSVKSLSSIIAQTSPDLDAMRSQIQGEVSNLFNSYFDSALASVTITTPSYDGSERYNIAIDLSISEKGKDYSLGRVLESINGVLQPILDTNNGSTLS